jgi:UDP-N-acetylmuramoyl-L-alanyl-D-glutamate--2,6-diaminopimelate ligase
MNIRKIVKKIIPKQLFKQIEPYGHLVESVIMNVVYGFPSHKMHIIGVTGTNGKTTTTFLIHRMLQKAGFKVGMLSTVAYGVGDDIKDQIQHMTTEKASILQDRLRDFARAGVEWVVVETSSHSLAQFRNWGLKYEIAVMTNVTNDHLDYHGTFDDYLEAKRRLFKIAAKNGRKFGVVNGDDPNAKKFIQTTPRSISYGVKNGDLKATNIKLLSDHSTYHAQIGDDKYDIRINIPGEFNVSNSLAAIAVGREIGLGRSQIEDGIASLKGVEGRMTIVDEGQDFKVIVDFAHTPDALENILNSVNMFKKNKLVLVFGACGDRDKTKRPVMGEIAARLADRIVLTDEENYSEDPDQIREMIMRGIVSGGGKTKTVEIPDRKEAIEYAFGIANKDDIVLLTGMGHEKFRNIFGKHEKWNDSDVARDIIKEIVKSK